MQWLKLLPALFALVLGVPAAGQVGLVANPGFETASVSGPLPEGWSVMAQSARVFTISRVEDGAGEGRACATIRFASPREAGRQHYAAFEQAVAPDALRGKRIRFTGRVRAEGTQAWGGAGLWIRVNGQDGAVLFIDNMRDRLVHGAEWAEHEIETDVPAGAAAITIGGLLLGSGQAWFDGFSLESLGDSPEPAAPAPLAGRGGENLAALARLVGVVRYFHPSPESEGLDWGDFTSRAARHVEPAADAEDLARRLREAFAPIAPLVHIGAGEAERAAIPHNGELRAWEYRGYGVEPAGPASMYSRTLVNLSAEDPGLAERVWAEELPGGVSGAVPLFAPGAGPDGARDAGALVQGPIASTGDDRWTRLAAVIGLWNAIGHFSPHLAGSSCDWDAVLAEALASAATDADGEAFLATLRRMTRCIGDAQAFVRHETTDLTGGIPLSWSVIEQTLVVTSSEDPLSGLRPGDRVLSIDGAGAADVLREALGVVSAAPHRATEQALLLMARGPQESSVDLQVQTVDGTPRMLSVRRRPGPPVLGSRPQPIAELEPGIWYVDLSRIRTPIFVERLSELSGARGIVFDVRGPSVLGDTAAFLGRLLERPVQGASVQVPVITRPDRAGVTLEVAETMEVEPQEPFLRAPKVFLTDARAIGQAEALLDLVRHEKIGTVVGARTAGAYGPAAEVELPGGYIASFTGAVVDRLDGERLQRTGIEPDVEAMPTIEGVTAGRDEVLEAGLEVLRGGM